MESVIQLSQLYPGFFYALVFLVSLMVGSFLNVVIYRLPIMMERSWQREYSEYFDVDAAPATASAQTTPFNLVKPDSTCPQCGHKIRAWENIPVISYLFLRGRCAGCKTRISARYPLVELLTAVVATIAAVRFGPSAAALISVVVCYLLVALIFIDLDKMLLPDPMTLSLLWLGLLASTATIFVDPTDAILGAAFGYLSLWSVYWLFKLATGKEGMGYGDFKLLAALGAFTGWQGLPVIILLSSCVGAVAGVLIMVLQNKGRSLAIPFGPYLAVAGLITLLYKDTIISAYLNWVLN
ncbi:prepilin peptidase [Alteromonas halophila]|uniref:Prepilin leader peptidase/N-methyltransferase n=1 Tax=Alteromonas halophila TaxID=516698 RepID=A0A918N0M9_9ALTE|nr:A24 family peptidase [Alteromonas halophila]GGW94047.1 type 4 prepilin-like proteins leader peptide-processing enzyme [Alteromonas halophila]